MKNKYQVFTPETYVNQMLDLIEYKGDQILGKYILENSCGEGNVLIEVVRRYIVAAQNSNYSTQEIKKDLERYIIGFEIDTRVSNTCIEKLNDFANCYGIKEVKWNINNMDYLKYITKRKFEFIVGNPPFIMYQEISVENREFLKTTFSSCAVGKFDYCYAFIEKSISELSKTGRMSYIIPNSIFKNVFGKRIRELMRSALVEIYDYKESSIFGNDILTSPAIICLNNNNQENSMITYYDVDNKKSLLIDKNNFGEKWLFTSDNYLKDYSVYTERFGDYFKVSNSVATLLNEAYIIYKKDIFNENETFIEVEDFRIEKEVLRFAASPRSCTMNREELIIFPYKYINDKLEKFEEVEFKLLYPGAYEYLSSFAEKLGKRKSDKSAKWFEYGRSQALAYLNQEKILISSIITNEVKTHRLDENTIPYSGFYIIPLTDKSLEEAEKILKSKDFFSYLTVRGINANGKSLRFSVNDILSYPIKSN